MINIIISNMHINMRIITAALPMFKLINSGFKYVKNTSAFYNIDESHALKHSMEVYNYANNIYNSELIKHPYLEKQREIIYMTAIGHDMCDKKYMEEKEGLDRYKIFLSTYMTEPDIKIVGKIIETMSYSKVKVNGFPDLGEYNLAYHIVREADLLSSYDVDRCLIYNMYVNKLEYNQSMREANILFKNRIFKLRSDKLFTTDYSKKESLKLHNKAKKNINYLNNILSE